MWKRDESYSEGEPGDKDSIRASLLTAGTAFFMAACLRRAVVLFLVEQWRVWVFLVLNLIVLAIFFTSTPSNPSDYRESQDPRVRTKQKKIKKRQCRLPEEVEKVEIKHQWIDEQEEIEEQEEDIRLSKDELNERVEAFIVMFKQHLISDAKNGGNCHTSLSYTL